MPEILSNGNVQLRDLKSRGLSDVFHVTRPYQTYIPQMYNSQRTSIVEKILARRGIGENREYLIEWKGYSSAVNGWEPQAHLMRHIAWKRSPPLTHSAMQLLARV